jgi:hypothetical protein
MAAGVKVEPERIKKTKPKAYIVRFAFGGLITAFAGFLATKYGPAVGGLFLGFPAILPASLTLVKKHEGEEAAGDDALGAAAGSIGMVFFAALIWGLATRWPAWLLLVVAMIVWLAISVLVWWLVRRIKE